MKFTKPLFALTLMVTLSCGEGTEPAFRCNITDGSKNGGTITHTEEDNEYTNGTRGRVKNNDRESTCLFAVGEYIQKASDGSFMARVEIYKNATGYYSPEYTITFSSPDAFTERKTYSATFWKGGVTTRQPGKITIQALDLANSRLSVTFTGQVHHGTFYPYNSKVAIFDKYAVIEQGYFENMEYTFDAFGSQYE